jgi:hypothetical protein
LLVFALAFPPAFNDTSIVAIELEVVSRGSCCKDGLDQKLKSNSFHPSNVMPIRFPPLGHGMDMGNTGYPVTGTLRYGYGFQIAIPRQHCTLFHSVTGMLGTGILVM